MHTAAKYDDYDIDKLKPYEANAKLHPEEQVAQLAASIQRFGFQQPVVVDESDVIVIGHGRYLAAQRLGLQKLPVWRVTSWTEDEKRAFRLADNHLNLITGWDPKLFESELQRLSDANVELASLGLDFDFQPVTERQLDADDTAKKRDAYLSNTVKQIVLYLDLAQYERTLVEMRKIMDANPQLKNNTEVVLFLLDNFSAVK